MMMADARPTAATPTAASLGLLDPIPNAGFDRQTALARRLFGSAVALVSIIDADRDRQVFKSQMGLPPPWSERGETPLGHSFCRLVQVSGLPLVVADARADERVRDNPAIHDIGIIAYLGCPVHWPDGRPIGALCVIEPEPRQWTPDDVALLSSLAAAVDDRICLLAALAERDQALAESAEASQAKSRFLAVMNHEIRTPLNSVLGMAGLLEDDLSDPAHREMAASIRLSGECLLAVVDDVLDIARLKAGRISIASAPFVPIEVVNRVADLHRSGAGAKGLALRVETCGDADVPRQGDAQRLQQVLHTLTGSAVQFSAEGEILIRVDATRARRVGLSVTDSGPGMTRGGAEPVPDPFDPTGPKGPRRPGGTGLGASIVRELVAAMGGAVGVANLPGAGTRVRIDLPFPVCGDAASASVPAAPCGTGQDRLAGRRLLVADDTPTNRTILQMILAREGAELTMVGDGAEAVAAWRPGAFDALLLDIAMPRLDGVAALREIRDRARRMGAEPPPAAAITANVLKDQVAEYARAGFACYVAKPFDRTGLVDDIARMIGP